MARILVVEDEVNLSMLYDSELSEEGHDVLLAHDGKKAIELALQEEPDLIVMDINLTEKMDGIESMSKILGEDKSIPIIINTGYSEYKENFMTWAADAYVVKSGDMEPLKREIERILNSKSEQPPAAEIRNGQ
jgi:DNA-binding response OmpR family regulator